MNTQPVVCDVLVAILNHLFMHLMGAVWFTKSSSSWGSKPTPAEMDLAIMDDSSRRVHTLLQVIHLC